MRLDTNMDMGRDVLGQSRADVTVHVHIRIRRITRIRLFIGGQVIKFGGWITGFRHTTVDITR